MSEENKILNEQAAFVTLSQYTLVPWISPGCNIMEFVDSATLQICDKSTCNLYRIVFMCDDGLQFIIYVSHLGAWQLSVYYMNLDGNQTAITTFPYLKNQTNDAWSTLTNTELSNLQNVANSPRITDLMNNYQLLFDSFHTIRAKIQKLNGPIFLNGYLLRYIHLFFVKTEFIFPLTANISNYFSYIRERLYSNQILVSDTESDYSESETQSIPETEIDETQLDVFE